MFTAKDGKKVINLELNGFELNQFQKEIAKIFDSNTKYIVANCSRQIGKSTIALLMIVKYLLMYNKSICYVTPQNKLARILFSRLLKYCSDFKDKLFITENRQELKIETKFGSTLQFFTAENISSIRGNTFTHVILDECAFLKEVTPDGDKLFENVLLPAFGVKGSKMLIISTPFGKSGLFYDLVNRAKVTKGWKYVEYDVYKNNLLSKESIEDFRLSMPESSFQQEFLCKFLDSSLTVFKNFDNCFKNYEFDYNCDLWVGLDISSTEDGDSTILTFINKYNQIESLEITGSLDSKYKKIAEYLDNHYKFIKAFTVETNGIGIVFLNELRKNMKYKIRNIIEFTTTNESKNKIINNLQIAFEQNNLVYKDKCLYNELSTFGYSISSSKKLIYNARSGKRDDRVMSLAMALEAKLLYPNSSMMRSLII